MIPIISPLIAFLLPAFVIVRKKLNKPLRNPFIFSIISFVSCCVTSIAEIFVFQRRINAGDMAGVEDTIRAVLIICIGVLSVTTVLNIIALYMSCGKDRHKSE